ncbi:Flavin-containing monooxygenase [Wickerhamomyces ciferrii]|uniref:Flavin-containing monooxygenase n=1 Tax=Wickerhamomyces ciferrii (strain ATCC 14091 / BCRC 22168 / CBS 111 / JCM 3599 / NBRC 0793 / NRRL Y-1031 F-60-10) TaxID=1206466 RepID=K0KLR7_WICCF|nr:Flavin-containing monooxygenase [Wickerhamomyces ciferrii]CCH43936.1 Flavin-containing monooxygenase [Wickerhamomyces ciferrii]
MAFKEIAVIGAGGIAGLASIFELLHVDNNGTSTIGKGRAQDPAFTKIVGFEQKGDVGGVWNVEGYKTDSELSSQDILDTEHYNDVNTLRPKHKLQPSFDKLINTSVDNWVETEKDESYLQWKGSAVYPRLYTNTPEFSLRYSTMEKANDRVKDLDPFLTHQALHQRLQTFADQNDLKQNIRFNSEVVKADKIDGKWRLLIRVEKDAKDYWYTEFFDAVIVSQGFFSVPFIPLIKGLSEYNKRYPGAILHSKSYRDPQRFKDKKVVILGGNISTIDIGQYLAPVAKEVIISRNTSKSAPAPWMDRCVQSFPNVSRIKEFLPDTKEIVLQSGHRLQNVDNVILATGYHVKSPIFDDDVLEYSIPSGQDSATSRSRARNNYLHTFNIEDPSIAFVGRLVVQAACRNAEAEAAAIAGVWSGYSKLPSKEEQYEWELQKIISAGGEEYFHWEDFYTVKETFYDVIKQYYPKDRPDPIGNELDDFKDYEYSLNSFERLFNDFKNGKIEVDHEF